jgi:Asp-tRNA(Asn)/Glu-tRNA(Gln) amidotransferase A subunit family amidase
MSTDALRLADALEEKEYPPRRAAANELRRLEAANAQLLDKVLQAIKEMRPAAEAVKDKPASWWLDRFEEAVKQLKEKNNG